MIERDSEKDAAKDRIGRIEKREKHLAFMKPDRMCSVSI